MHRATALLSRAIQGREKQVVEVSRRWWGENEGRGNDKIPRDQDDFIARRLHRINEKSQG